MRKVSPQYLSTLTNSHPSLLATSLPRKLTTLADASRFQEVDDSFSRQYSGVLTTVVENPEMGSESPVEICERDPRVWELVGGGSVRYGRFKAPVEEKEARGSLFFCRDLGVWMPKR